MAEEELKRRERLARGVKVRSDTIYAVSSWREMMFLLGPRLALIVGLLILPIVLPSGYWQSVICITGVYALLTLGFDFLANFLGLVCLGGALFTGVGGYISGILNSYYGVPLPVSMLIATIGGGAICTILIFPCLPLRGVYFAIVTFIYPLAAERLIAAFNIWGGTDGIVGLSMLTNVWINQYLILGVALVCCFGLRRLVNQDIGLVFRGVKDNDQAIRASGMNISWYKAQAVFIAASMGCFAGAYLAHLYGWTGMSLFAVDFSILPLAATVVGGPGTLAGPLLGSFILVPVNEILRAFGTLRIVLYAVAIVLFIVFWTEGLLNYFRRKYEEFEHWVRV